MREQIMSAVLTETTINGVRDAVIGVFEQVKDENDPRMGYVSGIITSDGPEHQDRNIRILAEYTDRIRGLHPFPIFSATDVFNDEVFDRINATSLPVQSWFDFWRDVLNSGYVTDIFMTPRWEKSSGARDELETAEKLGLKVHYVE